LNKSGIEELKHLIIFLVIGLVVINILMFLFGQKDLFNYFIANSVAYLIVTLFIIDLGPKSKLALNMISYLLFVTLVLVIILKVYKIVS
jgi:hypothetical protein